MKKILSFIASIAVFASCETKQPSFKTKKVKVLENNTVSYIHVPSGLDSLYTCDDTVWVNMKTHRIDDLDSTAMKCVIACNLTSYMQSQHACVDKLHEQCDGICSCDGMECLITKLN